MFLLVQDTTRGVCVCMCVCVCVCMCMCMCMCVVNNCIIFVYRERWFTQWSMPGLMIVETL